MGSKKKKNKSKGNIQTAAKENHDIVWPTTFRISARNLRITELSGVIFGCKHSTMQECFNKKLFGLPSLHFVYIRNIKPGFPLFLFNYSDRRLHGIFEAKSAGEMNIDRHAWISETDLETTPFPAQVRFQIKMRCQPLNEEQFKPIISGNYYEEKYFWNELDSVQTKNLIDMFSSLPMSGTTSTKSSSTVKKFNTPAPKNESFSNGDVNHSLGLKCTQYSEDKWGTADTSLQRSFASVVSANIVDTTDNSNLLNHDKESTKNYKQKEEKHFSNERMSYSSVVRNTNKCHNADICDTSTPAFKSAQSDTQNLEPDLLWDSPHWDCGNYFSHITDDPQSSNIAREEFTQRNMSDNFSTQVQSDVSWDDEPRHPSHSMRTLKTRKEGINSMATTQEGISDQSAEWNALWDAIKLDGRQFSRTPNSEGINATNQQVKHILTKNLDPLALVSYLDEEHSLKTSSHFANEVYGSDTASEYGADSYDEAGYVTAYSESPNAPMSTDEKNTEFIWNSNDRNFELDNQFHRSTAFHFSNTHAVDHLLPQLLHSVESLKVSQMVQAQKILLLEQQLAESKKETQELKQELNVLGLSCTPVLPTANSPHQLLSGFQKIFSDSIFLVGGFNESSWISSVDCYVPSSDLKVPISSASSMRSFATATKLNGELYVIGGKDINSNLCCSTVDSYKFLSNQWVKRPSLNWRRKGLTAVTVNSKIFAIGGVDELSECFSEVEMFEENLARWIPIKSMRQKRAGSTSAEINGIIYVVGGNDGRNHLYSVERFDPREDSWSLVKCVSTARSGHSMTVLNDKLFVMGGYAHDGNQAVATVEIFDPRKGEWMTGEPMKNCRVYAGAAVLGQSIYVMGGTSKSNKILDTVECYTETCGWQMTDLKSIGKRCSFSAIVM